MKRETIESFDNLVQDYYRAWFRFHPEQAVEAGIESYADLLRPFSDEDTGVLISLNEKLLDALDEIDSSALDSNREVDLKILRGSARLELHDLLEQDWRLRDPAGTSFTVCHRELRTHQSYPATYTESICNVIRRLGAVL